MRVALLALIACAPPHVTRVSPVRGAEHVVFPSRDADLTRGAPTSIDGWLFRPTGAGPRPAIVLLHGCAGLFAKRGDLTSRHRD